MKTLRDDDKANIDFWYTSCIDELNNGLPFYILYDMLKYREEEEDYIACAGIFKAINWFKNELNTDESNTDTL